MTKFVLSFFVMCIVSLTLSEMDPIPVNVTQPVRLVYASERREFRQMALDGTIPTWIDSREGSLMIPKIVFPPQDLARGLANSAYSSYKVAVPGLDNLFHPGQHFPRSSALSATSDYEAYMQLTSANNCKECAGGLLFPSLTNPDGSDIFEYDIFEPGQEISDGSGQHSPPVPTGCFYKTFRYLVCNQKDITAVPDLPAELIGFEMNETNLQSLNSSDFKNTSVLYMKLDFNAISTVSERTFDGIKDLARLSMEYNRITKFVPAVFIGLDKLTVLSVRGNQINWSQEGHKPAECCVSDYLPQLTYLNMAENPLGALNLHIFWIFRNSPIEGLNLQSCNLSYIDPGAFVYLTKLVHLDLFNNKNLIPQLDAMDTSHLVSVVKLGLAGNLNVRLETLPNTFIQSFRSTLIQLNLSGNLFPTLSPKVLAFDMPQLTALILNDCSIGSITDGTFKSFPQLVALYLARNNLKELSSTLMPPFLQTLSVRQNPSVHELIQDKFVFRLDNRNDLTSLAWLDMNFVNLDFVGASNIGGLNGLRYLQLRDAKITTMAEKSFSKLNELILLDLGENALKSLPLKFSRGLNKLMTLFLDGCCLNLSAAEPSPFENLINLQQMYLNNNKEMEDFHPSLIQNLTRLMVLNLSNNQLKNWQLGTTKFMSDNTNIDVSYNQLTGFPANIFDEFNHIGAVDFSHNNFFCSCEVEELKRLAGMESNVTVLNWQDQSSYTCSNFSYPNQPRINIADLYAEQLGCNTPPTTSPDPGRKGFTATVIECATIIALFILTCVVCYWKWNQILQAWFLLRRRVTIKSTILRSESDTYSYDAFISFNERDRHWVYTYLVPQLESNTTKMADNAIAVEVDSSPFRLCLHDRDFTAGERITNNIIENISKSRKVVIVLSQAYVKSNWCQYELNLSQHRLTEEERNDLVIILLEDVPKKEQNGNLRYLIRTRTYLAWACDIEGQKLFWQRLRKVLLQH